jgi:uncharacterized peroxidase-related enzyme
MARIPPLAPEAVSHLGTVPNLIRVLAHSRAALQGYRALDRALNATTLSAQTRARIAVAIAELNGADYCLSEHVHRARTVAKLDDAEITANRNGASNDPTADAAVRLAVALARQRGAVSDAEFAAFKAAGYGDAAAIEIAALVALNTLTNTVSKLARPDIDFPPVTTRVAA